MRLLKGYIGGIPLLHFPDCECEDQAWFYQAETLRYEKDVEVFFRLLTRWEQGKEAKPVVGDAVLALVRRLPNDDHGMMYVSANSIEVVCSECRNPNCQGGPLGG